MTFVHICLMSSCDEASFLNFNVRKQPITVLAISISLYSICTYDWSPGFIYFIVMLPVWESYWTFKILNYLNSYYNINPICQLLVLSYTRVRPCSNFFTQTVGTGRLSSSLILLDSSRQGSRLSCIRTRNYLDMDLNIRKLSAIVYTILIETLFWSCISLKY